MSHTHTHTYVEKLSISKVYSDFPFAHRQHAHDGHCARIHGHNWSFILTFTAERLDGNGFVVDFGKLGWVKSWLGERFDHTLLLNEEDPALDRLTKALGMTTEANYVKDVNFPFATIIVVPNCGCEGLARWIYEGLNDRLDRYHADLTSRGVKVARVTVTEDSRNSATYEQISHE